MRLDKTGDFFLWLQSGFAEVAAYAGTLSRPVALLARSEWADFANGLGRVDTVYGLDADRFLRDLAYRIHWLVKLRRLGFEHVIQPRLDRELWLEDWVILALGARESIGTRALDTGNLPDPYGALTDRWYTRFVEGGRTNAGHESIHNAVFAEALTGRPPTGVNLSAANRLPATIRAPGDYFVVAPGAGRPGRHWPIERFAAIVGEIVRTTHLTCVLTGSRRERALCDKLAQAAAARCINLAGKTTLSDMVALIGSAHFVIGNESSPCHIAAALDVPSVSVLGGGHFGRFLPYPESVSQTRPQAVFEPMECFHCRWNCVYDVAPDAPFPCIDRVGERAVLGAVTRILATRKRPRAASAS